MEKRISVKLPEHTHKMLKKLCDQKKDHYEYPNSITQLLNFIVQKYFKEMEG